MKIALITENSQAAKNGIIHQALTAVAEPLGHQVFNYGMYTAEDSASLTYVMNGLLTGILLNSKAADFVVTGCGTGMGSMLACNAMPGVFCGLVIDPTDAFLFSQINAGNAISMPYAKGFGWARWGALGMTAFLTLIFGWRTWASWAAVSAGEPKQTAAMLITSMLVASLVLLPFLLRGRVKRV